MKTQTCGVVLPTELAHKARIIAALEGKTRSRLMREIVEQFLTWTISSRGK